MTASETDVEVLTIELRKGYTGLGFNIRGGTDNSLSVEPGIYITTVRPNGAAAKDGRLREGDKIIEVNGTDLTSVKHHEAVRAFHNAKDEVRLKIARQKEKKEHEPTSSVEDQTPTVNTPVETSSPSVAKWLLLIAAIGGGGFVAWRYFCR